MNPRSIMSVGFIVGMNREREYWQNKIKEKIEKLENEIKEMQFDDRHKHETPIYEHDIEILEELIKGE